MLKKLLYTLLISCLLYVQAQDTEIRESDITLETVQKKIKELEETKLSDEDRKAVMDVYNEVIKQLKEADNWKLKIREYESIIQNVPTRLAALREQMGKVESETKIDMLIRDASLSDLEKLQAQTEAELAAANKEFLDLQNEMRFRSERRVEVPKLLPTLQKRTEDNAAIKITGDPSPLNSARQILKVAVQRALRSEYETYEKEISSYDARNALIALRRDYTVQRVDQLGKRVKTWQQAINERRKLEAERIAQATKEEKAKAINSHKAVRKLVEENAKYSSEYTKLTKDLAEVSDYFIEVEKKLALIQEDFQNIQEKAKTAGMTNVIGILLQKKKGELPDISVYQDNIQDREDLIPQLQLRMMELEEMRLKLSNIEKSKLEFLVSIQILEKLEDSIEQEIIRNLELQREHLDLLLKNYNVYFLKLVDLDAKERQFTSIVEQYSAYIGERILWTRSSNVLSLSNFSGIWETIRWLLSPRNWKEIPSSMWYDIKNNPFLIFFCVMLFIPLFVVRYIYKRKLTDAMTLASRSNEEQLYYTWKVLGVSCLVASAWPLLIYFSSWRLEVLGQNSEFSQALSYGFYVTFLIYVILSILRTIFMVNGLAEAHFYWSSNAAATVRKNLTFLATWGVPIALMIGTIEGQSNELWKDSLGRLLFIFSMVFISLYLFFSLKGATGRAIFQSQKLSKRFRYLYFPMIILSPIALAVLASFGFYYTALKLLQKLLISTTVLIVFYVIYSLLIRWLSFAQMSLVKPVTTEAVQSNPPGTEPTSTVAVERDVNVFSFISQAYKFLWSFILLAILVSMWFIWREVIPAFKILDTIELWSYLAQVTPDATDIVTITLSDLIVSIAILVVSVFASRNLPGLLEISVLQKLNMEKGMRFAVTTILSYIFITLGFLIAFQKIGIGWGQVQWLAAAFTVGLGFGLQEIFANFASGLIILFERPMRVGDIVTIGGTTGSVSKIKIRATTITDFDRKEMIVPNKEFITGRLVNWSLSDTITRIVIPVGIAYGSDTQRAHDILLKVANDNPDVLKDQKIVAFFSKFGESSLEFSLRVFIPGMSVYISVIHSLHMEIDKAFREAGIEIAFPQRDIHIRSICGKLDTTIPVADLANNKE